MNLVESERGEDRRLAFLVHASIADTITTTMCVCSRCVQEDFAEGTTTGPYSHLFQELLQPEAGAVA